MAVSWPYLITKLPPLALSRDTGPSYPEPKQSIVTSQAFFGTTQTPRYFFENIPGRYPAPEATEIVDSLASPVQHRDERQHVEFAEVERNSLAGPTRR